jgi:hypothetical protein
MSRKIDPTYIDFMVKEFNHSLKQDLHYIYVGWQKVNGKKKYFQKPQEEWLKVLDIIMDKAILLEEYEACAKLKKIRDQICTILNKKKTFTNSPYPICRN